MLKTVDLEIKEMTGEMKRKGDKVAKKLRGRNTIRKFLFSFPFEI